MLLPPEPKPAPPPFSLEVLARLPLAEAFYGLWNHLTTDDLLRPLYDLHRGASYEDQLTFPQLVRADPDGEANDIRLVPRVLPLARAAVAGPRLWVADRQFCDLDQPARFCAGGDHYLIRFSKKTGFHPDPSRPAQAGVDGRGRAFRE